MRNKTEFTAIRQHISDEEYREAKELLYKARQKMGLKEYDFLKRIMYVSANMSGKFGYNPFNMSLRRIKKWIDIGGTIYDFDNFKQRIEYGWDYFGVRVDTITEKSWSEVINETIKFKEYLYSLSKRETQI